MSNDTVFQKLTSINFTVKNLSSSRAIHIFNYPIYPGQTRDLLAIPEISESDIRHSLIKGELANFIRMEVISIVSSSIDLNQNDASQEQFLKNAGLSAPSINYVQYINTQSMPAAASLTIAAPSIAPSGTGSGIFNITAQACPYAANGEASQIVFKIYRDGMVLPPIRKNESAGAVTINFFGSQGNSGNVFYDTIAIVGSPGLGQPGPPLPPPNDAFTNGYAYVAPSNGALSSLSVNISVNTLDAAATCTLYIDGYTTAITVSFNAGQVGQQVATGFSVPISAGNLIWIIADTTAATSGNIQGIVATFVEISTIPTPQHSPGFIQWFDVPGDGLPHVYSLLMEPNIGQIAESAYHMWIQVTEQ